MRFIEVTPHDERWVAMFEEDATQIRGVFGPDLVDIHHIGVQPWPGLNAKPTIDIMPVVNRINCVDDFNDAMVSIGHKPKGENRKEGRHYFRKGGDRRTHHAHIYELGNPEIARHIVSRGYLRAHAEDARRYGALK